MNGRDRWGNLVIQMVQKYDAFHLPFALRRGGINGASPRIKTGKQIQRPLRQVEVIELRHVLAHDLACFLRWDVLEITGDNLS